MNQNRNQRTGALNSAQRNTVRVALATGATIATLIGAQTLALLEQPTVAIAARTNTTSSVSLDQQLQSDVQSNVSDSQSINQSDDNNSSDDNSSVSQQVNSPTVVQQSSIQAAPSQPIPVSRSSRH